MKAALNLRALYRLALNHSSELIIADFYMSIDKIFYMELIVVKKYCLMLFFWIFVCCLLLNACTSNLTESDLTKNRKRTEMFAMLTDPNIKKDYYALKTAAKAARVYQQNNKAVIDPQDVKTLNTLSAVLINHLHYQYHISPYSYNIHIYIGKNRFNSCYQYYDSRDTDLTGKNCSALGNCPLCNQFIKAVRARHGSNIIHTQSLSNNKIVALVDTFKLRNGDDVYLGFELSSID